MGCIQSGFNSSAYLACVGVAPVYPEEQVSMFADRVGATGAPWIRPTAIAFLRVNRMIYWKNQPGGLYGDCGANTASAPSTDQTISRISGQVATSDPEPISKGIITLVAQISGIFGAAHQQAVMTEQQTLCTVTIKYNQFADAMEAALRGGQIALKDASQQLESVHQSLASALSHIEKPYDAPYGYHKALDALVLFNQEIIYPSLVPTNSVSSLLGSVENFLGLSATGSPQSPSSRASAGIFSNPLLWAVAVVVAIFAFRGK